jgi:hypothetical protein
MLEVAGNGLRYPLALLQGYGSYAGKHLAMLVLERGEVADYEDFGMIGNAEIGLDQYASGAVYRYA